MAIAIPKLSEVGWTRAIAAGAIGIVCFFMVLLSTTGAWNASHNAFYTGAIAGVEILAQVALVLILAAPGKWYAPRKIVGALVFAAIAFVVVENGKMAITASFKDIFKDENGLPLSPHALREKANIADTTGGSLTTEEPAERKAVKTEIAELQVFQKKMSAMSPEGIMEAQSEMIPRCGYTGRVDGIRNVKTEAAMRKCGEQITNRLLVLQAMDAAPVSSADIKKNEAVELRAKADEIDDRTVWLNILLMALVGITATGVWAFVVWDSHSAAPQIRVDPNVFADLQEQADELARRKANLESGAEKAVKTKTKKKKVSEAKQAIEDMRTELAKREAADRQKLEAAIAEMSAEYVDDEEGEVEPEEIAPQEPELPAEPEPQPEAEEELELTALAEPEEPPETGNDLVPFVEAEAPPDNPEESAETDEESDDEGRPLQAAE